MLINRILTPKVKSALKPGQVTVLYGPRQVGKTTLLSQIIKDLSPNQYLMVNGDQTRYQRVLSSQDSQQLKSFIGDSPLLIIDEAQRIPNIGLNLKIIIDNFPKTTILVTGSASLELANQISEPLTGRKKNFMLYPISFAELLSWLGLFETKSRLEQWLIFGTYPRVLLAQTNHERENYLAELISSYLYKDILDFGGIKKTNKIVDLLRLLAFQIGQQVAISELASNLALNRVTVEKYLDLLEKAFVIYKVSGFSRNLRKEIAKTKRYYFYDNGVRNALIENFNPLKLRNDQGQLWENFLFTERKKVYQNQLRRANFYFWRTWDQKEIDLIEERQGKLWGFEFKWQGKMKKATKNQFLQAYPNAVLETITPNNFEKFLAG